MTSKALQQTRPFGIIKSVLDVDDYTTTVNTYENVYSWDTEFLQGKVLRFSAATNDLHVKILGSVDGGATYPITAEAEFTVAVATPVVKRISNYYSFLKIQVKPAVGGSHGVLTTTGSGSSIPDFSDIEVTVAPAITISSSALPTGAATEVTLADIKTAAQLIDNFISGNRGLVTEDNSAAILAALPTSLGKKAATASLSVVQADPTRTPVAYAKDMTGSAVALSAVSVICQDLWLIQVGSTGQAYWGDSSVQAGHGMPLSTTEPFHIQGPMDLANVYCIGNAADDVACCYTYEV